MKKLYIFLILLLIVPFAGATHIKGGEINLQHIDSNQYEVHLRLWRDCSGISLPSSQTVNISSSCASITSFTVNLVATLPDAHNNFCNCGTNSSVCNGGNLPGTEYHHFKGIVTLPPCSDWVAAYTTCCRNAAIQNLSSPNTQGLHIEAVIDNLNYPHNSSPRISNLQTYYAGSSDTLDLNYSAVDQDNDSLVYSLSPLYINGGSAPTTVTYAPGYTYLTPLPGLGSIDSVGMINYSTTNTSAGQYMLGIQVDEYDRATGNLKGTIRRDAPITIMNGTSAENNNIPYFGITPNSVNGGYYVSTDSIYIDKDTIADFVFYGSPGPGIWSLHRSDGWYYLPDSSFFTHDTSGFSNVQINTHYLDEGDYTITFQLANWSNNWSKIEIAPIVITVGPPSLMVSNSQTICIGDTTVLQSSAISNPTWSVLSGTAIALGTNMGCDTCPQTWVSPDTTTTYQISGLHNGQIHTDTVTVTVNSGFTISGMAYHDNNTLFNGKAYIIDPLYPTVLDSFGITSGSYFYHSNLDSFKLVLAPDSGQGDQNTYFGGTFDFTQATVISAPSCSNLALTLNTESYGPNFLGTMAVVCSTDSLLLQAAPAASHNWTTISGPAIAIGSNFECDTCMTTWAFPTYTTTYKLEAYFPFDPTPFSDTLLVITQHNYQVGVSTLTGSDNTTSNSIETYVFRWINNTLTVLDTLYTVPLVDSIQNFGLAYKSNDHPNDAITFVGPNGGTLDPTEATIHNPNGCDLDTFGLQLLPMAVNAGNDTSVCLGNSANLSASGALNYSWSVLNGDPIVLTQNMGCDTCATTWVAPSSTTTYLVTGHYALTNQTVTDTVTVNVTDLYTYAGSITTNGGANMNGKVYLITYNPADSSVTAVDSVNTSNGMYSFNTNENNVYIKAIPNSSQHPFDIPTYHGGAALFLSTNAISGVYCDTVTTNFNTVMGINLGGNGFIAGNVYQGAGKRTGNGDPVMGLSIVLHKLNDTHYEQTVTDQDGFFSFQQLTDGTYQVMADHPGIVNHTQEIIIDASQQEINGVFTVENSTFKLDSVLNVNQIGSTINISVFPNPVEDQLNIQTEANAEYMIMDLTGKVLMEGNITKGPNTIELFGLAQGTYLLSTVEQNGQRSIIRIIKK